MKYIVNEIEFDNFVDAYEYFMENIEYLFDSECVDYGMITEVNENGEKRIMYEISDVRI